MVNIHVGAWIMQRIDVAVRWRVASVLMLCCANDQQHAGDAPALISVLPGHRAEGFMSAVLLIMTAPGLEEILCGSEIGGILYGTVTASKRLGLLPTFTRATSRRVRVSMMEESSLALLLTAP
jgi:hypothetical protein